MLPTCRTAEEGCTIPHFDVVPSDVTRGSRRYQDLIYGKTDSRKDALDHLIRLHMKKQCFPLYVGSQAE